MPSSSNKYLRHLRIVRSSYVTQNHRVGWLHSFLLGCFMPFENFPPSNNRSGAGDFGAGDLARRLFKEGGEGPPRAVPQLAPSGRPGGREAEPELMPPRIPPNLPPLELMPAFPPKSPFEQGQNKPLWISPNAGDNQNNMKTLMATDYLIVGAMSGTTTEAVKQIGKTIFHPELTAAAGAGLREKTVESALSLVLNSELLAKSVSGAAKGFGIAGAGLATGYLLDQMIGTNNKTYGALKLGVDGVVVPGILMSSLPIQYKIVGAALAFGGTRVADYCNSGKIPHNDAEDPVLQSFTRNPSTGFLSSASDSWSINTRRGQTKVEMSSVFVPNQIDAFGSPVALLGLPARYKVAGVAMVYTVGRIANVIGDRINPRLGDALTVPK